MKGELMREVLKIENLKKYYGVNSNITKAVNGISLNISESEFVADRKSVV